MELKQMSLRECAMEDAKKQSKVAELKQKWNERDRVNRSKQRDRLSRQIARQQSVKKGK